MGKKSLTTPISTRKLISFLTKNGFYNKKGSKHGKYVRDTDNHACMVPRAKELSPGLSHQYRKELVEKHGFTEDDVLKI
jgi:predicted RNA binding protein YcfA (HicA-like mRNA interferase family)